MGILGSLYSQRLPPHFWLPLRPLRAAVVVVVPVERDPDVVRAGIRNQRACAARVGEPPAGFQLVRGRLTPLALTVKLVGVFPRRVVTGSPVHLGLDVVATVVLTDRKWAEVTVRKIRWLRPASTEHAHVRQPRLGVRIPVVEDTELREPGKAVGELGCDQSGTRLVQVDVVARQANLNADRQVVLAATAVARHSELTERLGSPTVGFEGSGRPQRVPPPMEAKPA